MGQKHLGEVRGNKKLKRKGEGVTVEETAEEERRVKELAANARNHQPLVPEVEYF